MNNLDTMYATPGVYELTNPAMARCGQYVRVEVDAEGVCHQLNPNDERDGALSREGWSSDTYILRRIK